MSLLRRILILPALAGLAFAAFSLVVAVGPASAQYYGNTTVSLTCNGSWPNSGSSCTVTPNFSVAPGGQFTVTMPDGTVATVTCPSGCLPGVPYTLTPSQMNAYSTYSSPQYLYPGGACVNGSYSSAYGCTSASVAFTMPYYNQPNFYPQPIYYPQPISNFPTCQAIGCFNNGNCNNWNNWCRNNGNCNNWWCGNNGNCNNSNNWWCGNNGNCSNSNNWWCRNNGHCNNGNMMGATWMTNGNSWRC